eukprot:UC4_evm3s182
MKKAPKNKVAPTSENNNLTIENIDFNGDDTGGTHESAAPGKQQDNNYQSPQQQQQQPEKRLSRRGSLFGRTRRQTTMTKVDMKSEEKVVKSKAWQAWRKRLLSYLSGKNGITWLHIFLLLTVQLLAGLFFYKYGQSSTCWTWEQSWYFSVQSAISVGYGAEGVTCEDDKGYTIMHVTLGSIFIGTALGLVAENIMSRYDPQMDFGGTKRKVRSGWKLVAHVLVHFGYEHRPFLYYFLWIAAGVTYAIIHEEFSFVRSLFFAVTSLSTGGLEAPKTDSTGMAPQKLFSHFDSSGNGILDFAEFQRLIKSIEMQFADLPIRFKKEFLPECLTDAGESRLEILLGITGMTATIKQIYTLFDRIYNYIYNQGRDFMSMEAVLGNPMMDYPSFLQLKLLTNGSVDFETLIHVRRSFEQMDLSSDGVFTAAELDAMNEFLSESGRDGNCNSMDEYEFRNCVEKRFAKRFVQKVFDKISSQSALKMKSKRSRSSSVFNLLREDMEIKLEFEDAVKSQEYFQAMKIINTIFNISNITRHELLELFRQNIIEREGTAEGKDVGVYSAEAQDLRMQVMMDDLFGSKGGLTKMYKRLRSYVNEDGDSTKEEGDTNFKSENEMMNAKEFILYHQLLLNPLPFAAREIWNKHKKTLHVRNIHQKVCVPQILSKTNYEVVDFVQFRHMVHAAHALFADLSAVEDQRAWVDDRLHEQFRFFAREDIEIMSPSQWHAWWHEFFCGSNPAKRDEYSYVVLLCTSTYSHIRFSLLTPKGRKPSQRGSPHFSQHVAMSNLKRVMRLHPTQLISGIILFTGAFALFAVIQKTNEINLLRAASGVQSSETSTFEQQQHQQSTNNIYTPPEIPSIIHQTWKTIIVPSWAENHVNSWKELNPKHQHILYSDHEIEEYIAKKHPELVPAWEKMLPIHKADLFRYVILFDIGGVYSDLDVTCSVPVREWTQKRRNFQNIGLIVGFEAVVGQKELDLHMYARKFQIVQWTMASVPGHPVLKRVLQKIVDIFSMKSKEELALASVIRTTGPAVWSDAVAEHIEITYGIKFGEKNFERESMRDHFTHIGDILILPERSFGSRGGIDDRFVVHGFQGTWKKPRHRTRRAKSHDSKDAHNLMLVPDKIENIQKSEGYEPIIISDSDGCIELNLGTRACASTKSHPEGEGPQSAFDNREDTKWLASFENPNILKWGVWLKFRSANADNTKACSYDLVSGNDFPRRDPKTWTISGRFHKSKEWVLLDSRSGEQFKDRGQRKHFRLQEKFGESFAEYRFMVTETWNKPKKSTSLQLAEWIMYDCNGHRFKDSGGFQNARVQEHTLASMTNRWGGRGDMRYYDRSLGFRSMPLTKEPCEMIGSIKACTEGYEYPDGEGPGMALDGNVKTKWLTFGKKVLLFTPSDNSNKACSYDLVSGNDFPRRDPKTWTISGRFHKSKEWVLLDSRSGEQFKDRGQRKHFRLQEKFGESFAEYRFMVTETWNKPKKSTSLQLAEWIMYDCKGSIFRDRNTARISIPPSATEFNLTLKSWASKEKTIFDVPKLIHQTWKSDVIPDRFVSYVETWLQNNPGYTYVLWTNFDNSNLIDTYFPSFKDMFENYELPIQRADAIRYFIMYAYGGIYVDLDFESLRPIDEYLDGLHNCSCIIGQEPHVHSHLLYDMERLTCNAAMASVPGHPFWKFVFKELRNRAGRKTVSATGPKMLEAAVQDYTRDRSKRDKSESITLTEPEIFYPNFDAKNPILRSCCESLQNCPGDVRSRSQLSERQNKACDYLKKYDYLNRRIKSKSIALHHWQHSWLEQVDELGSVHISKILEKFSIKYDT